jgi:peptidoglycan/LPS O-acetylase OafA/YrhL
LKYRKEIDGLRAIAVLPVILCHAGFYGFSGGYIGVDIFFVISGYLITTIILGELAQDKFSLKSFYERRAKRILPALSTVLVVTTVLAYILMPANLLKSYANSLMSVVTFTSNFHFFTTSGYFSTAADQKPLLHTWSLAVEEQFYLFFPILLGYLWVKGKKYTTQVILTLSIISLLLADFLATNSFTNANFYLIFSRAWELFAGALIALTSIQSTKMKFWQRDVLGITGLLLIAYAIVFFDKNTLFPSFYTLVPIVGTVLIISFVNMQTYTGKFLANRLFVGVGLISYSLYLWHQPFFAFLRLKSVGQPETILFVAAIALTFVCAGLSYKFVEQPFRIKPKDETKAKFSILQYAGLSIIFFIIIGLIGVSKRGFQARFADNGYVDSIQYSPKRKECHHNDRHSELPENSCRYFGENVTWATFGDSHTVEPAYALAKLLEPKGIGLLHLSFTGCLPSMLFDVKGSDCSEWVRTGLDYLEKNNSIENVYIGFNYNGFLFGTHRNVYPEIPNNDPSLSLTAEYSHLNADETRELYWQGLKQMIERLNTSGKTVYLQYPIPELPAHISNILTPFSIFGGGLRFDLQNTTTAEYYFTRNKFILDKLNSLEYGEKLKAVKPFQLMCHTSHCPAVIDGKSLYFDDGHLSVAGATNLILASGVTEQAQ